MEGVYEWAKQHPWAAGLLTLGAIFILLWLLGFFGGSSSATTSSNSNNLAAAYYNAEAAQTTAGTQLQMATEYYTNQTAQDQIQANAAQGIAQTQANMYTTIGGQNAGVETALGNDQLLASNNANNDALAATQATAYFNNQAATTAANASEVNTLLGSGIIPQELNYSGGVAAFSLPGAGTLNFTTGAIPNINDLLTMGYSPAEANQIAGF